ncbi:hypothetical protein [Desulfosporosinus lacus]|uniref:Uncharacterized protein n=1 Tax=Desulfosporosinus lacus DSM 15449 TaxID=1121420 RepID=A0A1M5S0V2_9FIRM|nr:hypothetical protein [Desulfosporosinus lacus]SHH32069.1 hypothetical protein SAMN02746098_00715 [Desulfosporosinus lacus DSM 15449]
MSMPFKSPSYPDRFPPTSAPCSRPPLDSKTSDSWNYTLKRLIPLLEYPTVGVGLLACTFFFFIAFLSDPILANITSMTLGIVVTITTFSLLILIVFIQVLL